MKPLKIKTLSSPHVSVNSWQPASNEQVCFLLWLEIGEEGGRGAHIRYRSHGGGDGLANRACICIPHHFHGIHKGYVRLRGQAPNELRWELGER